MSEAKGGLQKRGLRDCCMTYSIEAPEVGVCSADGQENEKSLACSSESVNQACHDIWPP